jgi:hypothetical protein
MEYVYHCLCCFRNRYIRCLDPRHSLVRRHRLLNHVRLHVGSLYESFRRPSDRGVPARRDRLPDGPITPCHLDSRPHRGTYRRSHPGRWGQRLAEYEDFRWRYVPCGVGSDIAIQMALYRQTTFQDILKVEIFY